MINRVPLPAKAMGFVGLLPFIIALFATFSMPVDQFLRDTLNTFAGRLMVGYATIYFCVMSGAFWGFAVHATEQKALPYILSLLPAFYVLSSYSFGGGYRVYLLILGFALLVPLDIYFRKVLYAPIWWLRLRIPLISIAILCLLSYKFSRLLSATFGYDLG